MVVGLRKVNALLKPIITLLPKIDDLLQQISEINPFYMTTCDFFQMILAAAPDQKESKNNCFCKSKKQVYLTVIRPYQWDCIRVQRRSHR